MFRSKYLLPNLLAMTCACCLLAPPVKAADPVGPAEPKPPQDAVTKPAAPGVTGQLVVTVGKSLIIDSPLVIKRLAYANGALVEAQAIGPKQVLLNGKAPGETSLIIWQDDGTPDGTRLIYDMTVRVSPQRLNAVREQIARDYPNADVNVTFDNDTAFVRGTVPTVTAADRIMAIVTTMSKAVNLLHVEVPPVEPQVLLKVRFANVDRNAQMQLGANFASTAGHQTTTVGTGPSILSSLTGGLANATIGSAPNIVFLRQGIDLLAEIQLLESKSLLEMLAEPNLLTYSGTRASFTAGGEFPYLTPQPTAGGTIFSVEFKPYGILLSFLPRVTPQGTIHMQLSPEVSALDYTNTVTIQGTAIPGLTTRKVTTEVDLDSGQSFVIAGLLDKQITESFNKIPGLGDIPILGKLFQSKTISKSNSELLIIITPEIVRPIPADQPIPELKWTVPFMSDNSGIPIRQPGMDSTGPVPVHPPTPVLPLEQLIQQQRLIVPSPITAPAANPPGGAPPAAPPTAPPGGGGAPTGNGGGGNGQ